MIKDLFIALSFILLPLVAINLIAYIDKKEKDLK